MLITKLLDSLLNEIWDFRSSSILMLFRRLEIKTLTFLNRKFKKPKITMLIENTSSMQRCYVVKWKATSMQEIFSKNSLIILKENTQNQSHCLRKKEPEHHQNQTQRKLLHRRKRRRFPHFQLLSGHSNLTLLFKQSKVLSF